jgi:hypothetical protein
MNLLAIILDGPIGPRDPRTDLDVYLPPIITLVCCFLLRRSDRRSGLALGIASVSALCILSPIIYGLLAEHWELFYGLDELAVKFFAAMIPFISIAVFRYWLEKKPNQVPDPTRSARGSS